MQCECSSNTGHNVNGVVITCAELVLQCRDKENTQSKEGKIFKRIQRKKLRLWKERKVEEFESGMVSNKRGT